MKANNIVRAMRKIILLSLIVASIYAEAESIVVADLMYVRDTGDTASALCFDDEGKECSTWSTFYLFEAKIKKHISGNELPKRFNVIFGRHALKKKDIKKALVKLEPITGNKEAQYQVIDIGFAGKVYCFESEIVNKLECYE